jgi:hypothetical protein
LWPPCPQERQALARELQRLQTEEQCAAVAKKQRAAELMAEVADSNAQQISRKLALAEQEREDEARIAEYIRHKDAREQVRLGVARACVRECMPCAPQSVSQQDRMRFLASPCCTHTPMSPCSRPGVGG